MVVFIAYFALLARPFLLSQHARSRSSGNRDSAAYSGQSISNGAISARSSGKRCCAPRLRASPRAPSSWPFTARIAARTAMAPGGPEPVARTLRNTASATCYFLHLRAKPYLLRRMDLPMSSLSEDKRAGHGKTLEKEEKTVRRCRNDTGPI